MERREAMRFRITIRLASGCRQRDKTRCASRRSMPLIVGRGNYKLTSRVARERMRVREWMRE
jgi:hypothetical protein